MNARTEIRRRIAAGVLALAALAGALFFYWQSLLDDTTPVRRPIPISELKPGPGFGAVWVVPEAMRAAKWRRTGARVWELGRALPLRVEEEGLVTSQGRGRFCVKGERLWFSATDNSSPLNNGRSYEFEVYRPVHKPAIIAVGLAAIVAGLGICFLPLRSWLLRLVRSGSGQAAERARLCRLVGVCCLSLAGLALLLPFTGLSRQVLIPPADMLQQPEGHFCYYLARWIRRDPFRVESARLFEDHKQLRGVALPDVRQASAPGSYVCTEDYVCFRATDLSAPSANGRTYSLKVFFFARQPLLGWSLFFGSIGLLLTGYSRRGTTAGGWQANFGLASWWLSVSVLSLCKLWVVAGEDSMAQSEDGWSYAISTTRMIWGEDGALPSHPAGFPFIAGLVAQFGLPWRMGLELLYLGACAYVARRLISLAGSRLAGLMAFLVLAWHPWTLSGFRDYMSDPVMTVLLLALLGSMFGILRRPATEWTWPAFAQTGGILFLWEWSRQEGPLVYASYGLFVALAVAAARRDTNRKGQDIRRMAVLLAAPLVIVIGLSTAVKGIYYQQSGVFAKASQHSAGLSKLMDALYRIKPEQELRYAPVTRQSLRAACEASLTLKRFEGVLLNPDAGATHLGESMSKIPGEFGSCLHWLLLTSLPGDRRAVEDLMLKAAGELNAALREGRLPSRRAWYPLAPDWRRWLPAVPRSFLGAVKEATYLNPAGESWGTYHAPTLQNTFDVAANRRAANIYPRSLLVEGAVAAAPGAIDSVSVSDEQGRWLGASRVGSSNGWENDQSFDIRSSVEAAPEGYRLMFLRRGKPQHQVEIKAPPTVDQEGSSSPASRTVEKRESNVTLSEDGQTFSYVFRAGVVEPVRKERFKAAEKVLADRYPNLLQTGLVIVCICILLRGRWERAHLRSTTLCLLLAAGSFAGRAALYGLLDANVGWGFGRYMRCVSPIYILILILGIMVATAWLRRWVSGGPPDPEGKPGGTTIRPG